MWPKNQGEKIIPGSFIWDTWIEAGSAACKANTQPAVLWLWPRLISHGKVKLNGRVMIGCCILALVEERSEDYTILTSLFCSFRTFCGVLISCRHTLFPVDHTTSFMGSRKLGMDRFAFWPLWAMWDNVIKDCWNQNKWHHGDQLWVFQSARHTNGESSVK